MIVTEAEASFKRCQEGFPAPFQWDVSKLPTTSPMHCIGSACMAWQWWLNNGDNGIDRSLGDDRSKGFCGKTR